MDGQILVLNVYTYIKATYSGSWETNSYKQIRYKTSKRWIIFQQENEDQSKTNIFLIIMLTGKKYFNLNPH